MRKLLLTTAFILPLSFVPAFAQTATEPATDAPAADMTTDTTTDAPATDMGTDATMPADGMAADTAEADSDAMATEMASSDKVTTEQGMNELRLDWITGTSVTSPTGDAIGDIADLILDSDTGEVKAAVIGVGGFLGIGEKQIAVPFEQLSINYDAQEITSELTTEEADAAPEYVFRERENAPAADGTMAPADGATAPADGAMAPANGAMEPADGAMAPTDGAMEPTDGAMAPADGAMEPADGAMAPADGAMEPADGAMAPADGTMEPATDAPATN